MAQQKEQQGRKFYCRLFLGHPVLCKNYIFSFPSSWDLRFFSGTGASTLNPRSRTRTTPASTWCRRRLGSQNPALMKSRSQYRSLTFRFLNTEMWGGTWHRWLTPYRSHVCLSLLARGPGFGIKMISVLLAFKTYFRWCSTVLCLRC